MSKVREDIYTFVCEKTHVSLKIWHNEEEELGKLVCHSLVNIEVSAVLKVFFLAFTVHNSSLSSLQVSSPAPLWKRSPFPAPRLETDCMCASVISAQRSRGTCPWTEVWDTVYKQTAIYCVTNSNQSKPGLRSASGYFALNSNWAKRVCNSNGSCFLT